MPTALAEAQIDPDPELSPRQNLIFLLQVAAEIEHSLLVQYLYAAYSLKPNVPVPGGAGVTTSTWKRSLLAIAKEEMGHLLSVQNVLRYVGGPLHFDRQHFPYRSKLYPFPFVLQPFTKKAAAKYVFAEMADPEGVPPGVIPPSELADIVKLAVEDADSVPVNHVGTLYKTIINNFGAFHDQDFRPDSGPWQALSSDWDQTDNDPTPGIGVRVFDVTSVNAAVSALTAIAIQGEGNTTGGPQPPAAVNAAHFKRFYDIYHAFPDGFEASLPVATNPNTTDAPTQPIPDAEGHLLEDKLKIGRISKAETLLWAHLFNVRYRMLLTELAHALLMPTFTANGQPAPPGAAATPRATLVGWIYDDMANGPGALRVLAPQLAALDRTDAPSDGKAGAPFELPLTLDLPDRAPDRWQLHHELLLASGSLIQQLDPQSTNQILNGIRNELQQRLQVVNANAGSGW
jgi:hypothetical protein